MLSIVALFGGYAAFSAQGRKPEAKLQPTPAVKPHEPLKGKGCVECHKRVVSSTVQCLLAKGEFCALCHEVPAEGGPARLVASTESPCFKCHSKDAFKGSFIHGPTAVSACVTCHDPHGGNVPGMLRTSATQMCLDCHTEMGSQFTNARFRHMPAVTGCTDCHSPHSSEERHMLKAAIPGLCGKCHEKVANDLQTAAVKHSPTTESPACMNCHNPHTAQKGNLLVDDELDVCLKCHDKTVKSGKQEFIDMKKLLATNPDWHGPIERRDCSACHNPHGSSIFRLLTSEYPKGVYAPFFTSNYDLCFRCHDSALATAEHTTSKTEFRNGDRNLHYVHVNRESHGRTCSTCHKVHASTLPKHMAVTVPFGNWELPLKFEKTPNGGSCTPGCHAEQKYDRRPVQAGQQ